MGSFDYSMNRLSNLITKQQEIVEEKRRGSSIQSNSINVIESVPREETNTAKPRSESRVTLEIKNILS